LNDALQMYQEINNLQVPDTPSAQLKQDAEQLNKDAARVAEEATQLYSNHVDDWLELKKLIEESEVRFFLD